MNLYDIIGAIEAGRWRYTRHGRLEAKADGLTEDEINFAVIHGEIIENYPDDKPLPSCLIYGRSPGGGPIHSVWGYNQEEQQAAMITVYRPDPNRWVNWIERRRQV